MDLEIFILQRSFFHFQINVLKLMVILFKRNKEIDCENISVSEFDVKFSISIIFQTRLIFSHENVINFVLKRNHCNLQ